MKRILFLLLVCVILLEGNPRPVAIDHSGYDYAECVVTHQQLDLSIFRGVNAPRCNLSHNSFIGADFSPGKRMLASIGIATQREKELLEMLMENECALARTTINSMRFKLETERNEAEQMLSTIHRSKQEQATIEGYASLKEYPSNFYHANLQKSCFRSANCRGVIFNHANLVGTSFVNADLTGATFFENTVSEERVNLNNPEQHILIQANFMGASGLSEETKRDLIKRGALGLELEND